jgi:hypothetical protein
VFGTAAAFSASMLWVALSVLPAAGIVVGWAMVAAVLLWMRTDAMRATPIRRLPSGPVREQRLPRRPSLAHLVWPAMLLPISGLLTSWALGCPGASISDFVFAAGSFFGPPVLLAVFVVTLLSRAVDRGLVVAGAVLLSCAFVAACVWAYLMVIFLALSGCS